VETGTKKAEKDQVQDQADDCNDYYEIIFKTPLNLCRLSFANLSSY
jgi:hypothetical protein